MTSRCNKRRPLKEWGLTPIFKRFAQQRGCRMVKNALCLFVLGFCGASFLSAQEGFLAGVKAENLRLAGIETEVEPADTVGYWVLAPWRLFLPYTDGPSFSPDEKKIVYSGSRGLCVTRVPPEQAKRLKEMDRRQFDMWEKELSSKEVTVIGRWGLGALWSPSGDLIAYLSLPPSARDNLPESWIYGPWEVWVTDPNGKGSKNLTPGLSCNYFAWSPDGQLIAVAVLVGLTDTLTFLNALLVFEPRAGVQTVLDTVCAGHELYFCWAPSSKLIAYSVPEKLGGEVGFVQKPSVDAEVFVINADGTAKTQLTYTTEVERGVKWMPDGKRILVERIDPSYETDWELVYLVLETVN